MAKKLKKVFLYGINYLAKEPKSVILLYFTNLAIRYYINLINTNNNFDGPVFKINYLSILCTAEL